MKNPDDVLKFIQSFSRYYSRSVIQLKQLAIGGEAIVFRMFTTDNQELVAKCTLFDENSSNPANIHNAFLSILRESQILKLLNNSQCIPVVKEEMFILDENTSLIKRYLVIVEKANYNLQDLLNVWKDYHESQK